mmetsp:Transcript_8653/g.14054  ORF Transcript_8653/g.14054 Transcript_8653/m.14054 type:complete len:124 (-) Transcript_8653:110-481(-)
MYINVMCVCVCVCVLQYAYNHSTRLCYYCVFLSVYLCLLFCAKDKSITPCLVVINTTGASYISPGAPAAAYDLSFISPAPANPFAEGVEQIKAMGIQKTDQEISRALLSADGDISTAVAMLLS